MRPLLLITVLAVLGPAAPAQATLAWTDARTQTIRVADDHGLGARSLGPGEGAVTSPDGRLVAYGRPVEDAVGELVVAPVDGSAPPRRLASAAAAVAFSPDGGTIVALSLAKRAIRTVAIPTAGGPAVRLVTGFATVAGFPDRATVTLTAEAGEVGATVVDVPLAGGGLRVRARDAFVQSALAPSGRLAFTEDRDGNDPRLRLTRPARKLALRFGGDDFRVPLGWLPGERELLIEILGVGAETHGAETLDVRTGRVRRIASRLSDVHALSRDGRFILASRRAGGERILAIPVRPGGATRVLARGASEPSWSR